jgi:hypothetical protein
MTECSVCLQTIDSDHIKKVLSCGHEFHYRCYMNIVHHSKNYFINCPLCRTVNEDITKPFEDPEKNLRLICARKVGKVRCVCKTKSGRVCKRKASLFNYGMCYQHNKNVLKKEHYKLMENYCDFVFCQRYHFLFRLYTIDIGKKLILKYSNEKTEVQDILFYWFKYLTLKNISFINNYSEVYDYYQLEKPDKGWIQYCSKNHVII